MGLNLKISDHSSEAGGGCNGCDGRPLDMETYREPVYQVRWMEIGGMRIRLCRDCWTALRQWFADLPELTS